MKINGNLVIRRYKVKALGNLWNENGAKWKDGNVYQVMETDIEFSLSAERGTVITYDLILRPMVLASFEKC